MLQILIKLCRYDNHRESILQGKDAEQGEQHDAINLWGYFTNSCFDGFDKENDKNFYKVYADIFEQLDKIERDESEDYGIIYLIIFYIYCILKYL